MRKNDRSSFLRSQRLPRQFFAAIGTSRLNEIRLSG